MIQAGLLWLMATACQDMTIKLDDPSIPDTGEAPGTTWYADTDGDGYGDPGWPMTGSNNPGVGRTLNADDCDDSDSAVHPGATERCDGVDNDCDEAVDEAGSEGESTWYADEDGDGYGDPGRPELACEAPDGAVVDGTDCDDTDPQVHPGAADPGGDGLDADCDGRDPGSLSALLFSETLTNTIWRISPDGSESLALSTSIAGPADLTYAPDTRTLYVTRWDGSDEIHRMAIDGSALQAIYSGSGGGQGVALDPAEGLLFWGEYYAGLWVGSMDGTQTPRCLVSSAALSPASGVGMGVRVDTATRKVYFFSRDNSSAAGRAIWRVNYDGSGLERLHDLEAADCMTLEPTGGFLYFSDYLNRTHEMWRMSLDGSNPERLFALADQQACGGVAVDANTQTIYYQASPGSNGSGTIWRSDLYGNSPELLRSSVRGGQSMLLIYD